MQKEDARNGFPTPHRLIVTEIMNYLHSQRMIQVGDRVNYAGERAVIVFVIDDDCYSQKYGKQTWSYLGKGLGIEMEDGTLYHLPGPDEDLEPYM